MNLSQEDEYKDDQDEWMEGGVEEKKEEEKDEDEGAGAAKDGSVGEMKSGDYMIHVFIESCKEILVP